MDNQKRILILVNHDVVIYNFRKELVERLLKEGYVIYISSPYGERIDLLIKKGCQYIETPISRHGKNPLTDIKLFNFYIKMMKKVKPNVVLTYTIKPNIYGGMACEFLNIPYIGNITGLGTAVENNGIIQGVTVFLYKLALRKINCLYFQNDENRQFFIKKEIALGKHQLIPGSGVNLEEFKVLPYPTDKKIEFVFISRIMKEKGIDQYIEAAKYIREKYSFTRFHVCGFCEEEYEEKLKELEGKKILIYHGMIEDVREILKITHCTIHPSYYPEGISNVLLETCASGRPVITTDRSGCREVVENGINGYIIPPCDSKALKNKIEQFIILSSKEKKTMGLLGRKKVENQFNRQIVIESYMKEIKKIDNFFNIG